MSAYRFPPAPPAPPARWLRFDLAPIAFFLGIFAIVVTSCLTGCGSASAAADIDAFNGTARTMAMVEKRCTEPNVDAGRCDPAVIRGLTHSARCLVEPRLEVRGLTPPDAGASICAPDSP